MTAGNLQPARKPSNRTQEDITLQKRRAAMRGGRKIRPVLSVGPCHTQPPSIRDARGIANMPHARSAVKIVLRRWRGVIGYFQVWGKASCLLTDQVLRRGFEHP